MDKTTRSRLIVALAVLALVVPALSGAAKPSALVHGKAPVALETSTVSIEPTDTPTLPPVTPTIPAPVVDNLATFWLQQVDSCKMAMPGASYQVVDDVTGLVIATGTTVGDKVRSVYGHSSDACAIQRGNCVAGQMPSLSGCLSFFLPEPASGLATYTLTETSPASYPNLGYSFCLGGNDCSVPESIHVSVDPSGAMQATSHNVAPNVAYILTWPNVGTPYYLATPADPVVTHNSAIGTLSCDGDADSDDHVSGGEGGRPQCDSDSDR